MTFKEDKIKDLFASKLKDFKADVPASLWSGIDQKLSDMNTLQGSNGAGPAAKTGATIGKKIALVAVGIAASVATLLLVLPGDDLMDGIKPVEQTIVEEKNRESIPVEDRSALIADASEKEIKPKVYAKSRPTAAQDQGTKIIVEEDKIDVIDTPATTVQEEKKEEKEKEKREKLEYLPEQQAESLMKPKGKSPYSLNVKANMGLIDADMQGDAYANRLFSKGARSKELLSVLDKTENEIQLTHRQPISVGILVSKEIAPNLSLETGIVYTHLSSKITSSNQFEIRESQKFDYLGIPINVNYTFYSFGKVNVYASGGIMVQKDIKGSYSSRVQTKKDNIISDDITALRSSIYVDEPSIVKKGIKQANMQWSAHTVMGVSYPIYKAMNIYGTIGGAYYLDAKNEYETIYTEKKIQVDLNLGLKFNF